VNQRFFLGGDENFRGFDRKELPGDRRGYFTVLYQGLELRAGEWFPLSLQPFLFLDFAQAGDRPASLDPAWFYAPGLGLRYDSIIGTLRASVARSFARQPDPRDPAPHAQFFLSLGKEF
jgi:outer membrane translocation and assembly module TamA